MLLLLTAVLHLALGIALYRRTRTLLDPLPAFPIVWGCVLVGIAVAANYGYNGVDAPALLIVLTGTAMFTAGGIFGRQVAGAVTKRRGHSQITDFRFTTLAAACIIFHIVFLPIWWREINALTWSSGDLFSLAYQVRSQTTMEGISLGFFAGNYLVAGFIIIPLLAVGVFYRRVAAWLAAAVSAPWIVANLLTNGRSVLLQLVVVLVYLYACSGRRFSWKFLLLALALFLSVFVGGALLVGKGDVDIESDGISVGSAAATNFFDYVLQGPILFSSYLDKPWLIVPSWDALRVPCAVLERFALCTPGPLHQEFLPIGQHGRVGNVYSIYLSVFPKYGYLGTVFFLFAYGLWANFHHRAFKLTGSLTHGLVAAYLLSAVFVSVFNDQFGPALNLLAKVVVVTLLLRRLLEYRAAKATLRLSGERGRAGLYL